MSEHRAKILTRRKQMTPRENLENTLTGTAHAWGTDQLNGLAILSAVVDDMIRAEVAERRDFGDSWAQIGASLGISKQAAQQRYSVKAD